MEKLSIKGFERICKALSMNIREDEIIIKKEQFHYLKMQESRRKYFEKMAEDLAKENFKLKNNTQSQ